MCRVLRKHEHDLTDVNVSLFQDLSLEKGLVTAAPVFFKMYVMCIKYYFKFYTSGPNVIEHNNRID